MAVDRRRVFVDLAAARRVAAERAGDRIAVEVQTFAGESDVENLHTTVGQYAVYRAVLDRFDPGRRVYLAVSELVYAGIFTDLLGRLVVAHLAVRMMVFDPDTRRVTQWIS